ncbi:sugar dehydrogenase complex small subunit [Gluconobacter sp.]|uniref:sugar dehydrogenase complex small subunit n=1 Tax=Gluconobacter sp. TaxID=1876758 RepID=UPI0039E9F37C
MTKDRHPSSPVQQSVLGRRSLLLGTIMGSISVAAGSSVLGKAGALAATPLDETFLAISRAITGRQDLNPVLSSRLCSAMQATFPGYATTIQALASVTAQGGQPNEILERSGDLKKAFLALNAAWYTGSVEDRTGAPMVAYYDALMYQPTKDGLPVPTYCFARPGWWTETPPALGIPIHAPLPKTPPPPAPPGVESKIPPQSPPLKPITPSSPPYVPKPRQEH